MPEQADWPVEGIHPEQQAANEAQLKRSIRKRKKPKRRKENLSLSAASAYSCSSARSSDSAGGGSMKSKFIRSLMPRLLSISTTVPVQWGRGTSSSAQVHEAQLHAQPAPSRGRQDK